MGDNLFNSVKIHKNIKGLKMASQAVVSGAAVKKNSGVILHGGTVVGSNFVSHALRTSQSKFYGAKVPGPSLATAGIAGSPISTGVHAGGLANGHFAAFYLTGGTLAGVAKTQLNTPAASYSHRRIVSKTEKARRLHVSSINAWTGAVSYGANRGDSYNMVDPSASNGTTDSADAAATGSQAVPGELTVMVTGLSASMLNYSARTNP